MSRFLTISFVALALLVGAAGVAPAAHAQSSVENGGLCEADGDCISDVCGENGVCAAAPADRERNSTDASTAGASVADTVTGQNNTATLPAPPPGLETFGPVMTAIMTLFAWLVGVAAITLDNAVYYTVVTMGDYVKNLTAVGVAWRILRDLGNIAFIFGFLAIGITVILDVDWYGGWTKLLPKLLIAAIFLNFSLFITEAVIDTGNLFATQFYTQINGGQAASAKSFGTSEINNEGISNKIMGQLGLQTIYGNGAVKPEVFKAGNSWIIGFMGIILFIVTAFVMFSLSFILVARFVILVLLIIAAPIGFAGYAIPQLAGVAKMWKDELIKQTITAPVLFLLLYIALAIITDAHFLTGFNANPDWTGWITGSSSGLAGFASMILSFLVAIGLLLAVTILAKKLGAFGASAATKWGSKLSGATIAARIPGFIGRHTVGRAGNYAAKGLRGTAFGKTFVGRGIAGTLEKKVAGATFDVRNTGLGKAGAVAGLSLGTARTTGFTADQTARKESKKKAEEEYQKAVHKKEFKEAQDTIEAENSIIKKGKEDLAAGRIDQPTYDTLYKPHEDEAEKAEKVIVSTLSKMSTAQIEELDGIKKGVDSLVTNLSPQQFESLMKSDKLSETQKGTMKETRFKELNQKIKDATDAEAIAGQTGATQAQKDDAKTKKEDARKELAKVSMKELPHLNNNLLSNDFVRDNMTNDQYESVGKEGVLNKTEKTALDERRKSRFVPSATNSDANIAAAIKTLKWNKDQINKLPVEGLKKPGVLDALQLDAITLIDIVRKGNLSATDRKELGDYVTNIATTPGHPYQSEFMAYLLTDPTVKSDLRIT